MMSSTISKKKRTSGVYTLESDWGEQVTRMDEKWHVVHHTEMPEDHWWAVRHECNDGMIYGMAWRSGKTFCQGCQRSLPSAIDGFITMMKWVK